MINIDRIILKNVVTYKDQPFTFKEGLSLVRGENRAGKSLLFSSLANLLYFSHPLSDKKDVKTLHANRDSKKDSSSIELEMNSSDLNYVLTQKSVKDSVVYQIQENGIDLDSRTIVLSKQVVENIFSQPEDIFFTSTYLTSYRNHPLLHGSTSQRYDFFEKLFNFDLLDYCYGRFNTTLKELDSKEQELKSLQANASDVELRESELKKAESELDMLQARRDIIQSHLSELTQVRIEVIRLQDMQSALSKVQKSYSESSNSTNLLVGCKPYEIKTNLLASLEENYLKRLQEEKELHAYEGKKQELESLQAKERQLLAKQADFTKANPSLLEQDLGSSLKLAQITLEASLGTLQGKDLEQWKVIYDRMDTLLQSIQQELVTEQIRLADLDKSSVETKVYSLQEAASKHSFILEDTNSKLEKIKALQGNITTQHRDGETIKCPTCLNALSKEQLHDYRLQLESEYNTALTGKELSTRLKDAYTKYLKYLTYIETIPSLQQIEKTWQSISFNKQQVELLTSYIDLQREIKMLVDRIQGINLPTLDSKALATNLTYSSSQIRSMIDSVKDTLKLETNLTTLQLTVDKKFNELKKLLSSLALADSIKLGERLTEEELRGFREVLENQIAISTSENVGMQTSITTNSVTISMCRREIETLKRQVERIQVLKEECKRIPLLKKLVSVFHPKGFRLEKINQFTKIFEQTLNKYAGFLFMENFNFQVVVEKRDLQILATRSGKVSDVRYLSGSESRCFQLLCLISILSLLPTSKRANICILDEMDAGCDEGTTKMYYEKFLPELKNIVPSITVITPLGDTGLYINEDRSYMVRKINGVSTIEEVVS